jgi:spore germination cell wall hydrolase CwlJ-like protein
MGTGNIVNPVAQNRAGTDAFAFAPRANGQVHQQSWRAQRVYQDPNIELEQRRSAQY